MPSELDPQELEALRNVVLHFKNYRNSTMALPEVKKKQAKRLLDKNLDSISEYFRMLDTVEDRIVRNSIFLKEIVKDLDGGLDEQMDLKFSSMYKIRTVLKQFTRDWSLEG